MADEPAPDGLSDFSSLFRLPGTDESIAPVDLEQLKFMIRAILAARQFSPQGEVGFDVRFLLQWFGSDVSHLWALWIRSAALDRLLRYQPQHAWITESADGLKVHDAVIETAATLPLSGSSFDFQLFLQKVEPGL
jgi:hypothetical protein